MATTQAAPQVPAPKKQKKEFVHPSAKHARKKAIQNAFAIEPISAFYIFLGANIIAALFAPIQDCDETFNYWEPTHYLSHGYGLQTWEYSPDYAIRSWLYIAIHALGANIRRLLPRSSKVAEFYFLRYLLAFGCALCQTLMWKAVCLALNPRVGLFFIAALVFSPGNFHSSTAYLPSSFAMYMGMLGAAAFMNWRGGLKTSQGMFWFALGGVLGWPFAIALCAPFVLEEVFFAMLSDKERFFESFIRLARGVVATLLLVAFDTAINTFFYRKFEIVTWNIIKYNVFSSTGGPDLYGTEPWTFYFKNLALNFNVWFVLALLSLPLFLLQKLVSRRSAGESFQSGLRTLVFLSPFYLWLGIFTLQPHKEERFMYPAYPFLALNAALALHTLLALLGNAGPKTLIGRIPAKVKLAVVALGLLASVNVGLARVWGLYTGYHAPLDLYAPLATTGGPGDTVCFGKDWYRFPTSFFLPRDMRAKFVRSEFRGLLPGEFSEARTGFGFWSGTWLPTSGLNDRNEEDPGKYADLRTCVFLVDTQFPERRAAAAAAGEPLSLPPNEPDYAQDVERWEEVRCLPFLDAERTHFLARALWLPDWEIVPERLRRKWGRHCLLKRRK
ncbi:glycosyltransferase family 22 protein [Thermothelomyces thermophilus ATCC 42464]|uniref:Mannosyltransferase n=1 Tax=Thermothelomyces thermophilus (strain ATCC 42464 / BCRC 31852 / DSM 1799) TaxID=573729 RepID=G2QLU1_THET4|nr:glycosyltransferase family 22 protein [Thermothelomyces thermophilus ATCC 42464]AEO60921.1 glycosyltransferase family 22 protein [Thermothelomyces thermophilus ATCC 42464]